MLKFPPQLIVHKDSVVSLLYVVAGLVMTATAGSRCVDVAVMAAQDPVNLRRLSVTLITLMGLRHHIHENPAAKRKLKKLYFTDSFNHLLETGSEAFYRNYHSQNKLHGLRVWCWLPPSPEMQTASEHLMSPGCLAAPRRRIYYILIFDLSSRLIFTLRIGKGSCSLNTYSTLDRLRWLRHFSSKARKQGDVILLLLAGKNKQELDRMQMSLQA